MKTVVCSIAVGSPFEDHAQHVLDRFCELHKESVSSAVLIGSETFKKYKDAHAKHPAWLKPHLFELIPDADRVVFLDADTWPLKPMMDLVDGDAHISACIDLPEQQRRERQPKRRQFKAGWYFNTGVIVIRKTEETLAFMKLWWDLRKRRWDVMAEQDPFNRALHDLGATLKVQELPQSCNALINRMMPQSAHIIHWAGVKTDVRDRELRLCRLIAGRVPETAGPRDGGPGLAHRPGDE